MSDHSVLKPMVINNEYAEGLGIIKEKHVSPIPSRSKNVPSKKVPVPPKKKTEYTILNFSESNRMNQEDIDKLLKAKEETMNAEFQQRMDREVACLIKRFDYILQNEQTRTSYMLSEAHRERKEKIQALQTQLECKNLAGLMYVMCSERRKSKLEKMRLKEEYSSYIRALQDILSEGQTLILNLSRGYKTAARVDHEWRRKMKSVMAEFQIFVSNFVDGTPEANQFFFDLPRLMTTETPTVDNPDEDPCDDEELDEEEDGKTDMNKTWWERLDDDNRPFVMFGDMADFMPPQRREVLKHIKAAKTAPKRWKQYVFNNMFVEAECSNTNAIKDEYTDRLPIGGKWECHAVSDNHPSKVSIASRRLTTTSMDLRGNMGSVLKIITLAGLGTQHQVTKSTLLGARDSIEIVSATKLREKVKHSDQSKVTINVAGRRTSIYEQYNDEELSEEDDYRVPQNSLIQTRYGEEEPDDYNYDFSSILNDSLEVIQSHVPDQDHTIHYEKVCPMDKCKRMQMRSFLGSLPSYMRASPFTHFEQTFEEYEACTPEQLAILKQRLEEKKKKERADLDAAEESPLADWPLDDGVGVQTSDIGMMLPPCTCELNDVDDESQERIFNLADLIPVKQIMNKINKEFFFANNVVFDRFKVIGQESTDKEGSKQHKFKKSEVSEIKAILNQHPSLLEIFQANTQC